MIKILVAEDSSFFRRQIVRSLESTKFQIVEAENGRDALDLLLADSDIEIAIVDWNMPYLSGPEVCKQAKLLRTESFIYCILFTSQDDTGDVIQGMDSGADDFIAKSRSFEELHARIRAGRRIVELHQRLHQEKEQLQVTNRALLRTARELKEKEGKLAQKSRLESIGSLAAGIAHELNTPLQYIRDNTTFVVEEIRNLTALFTAYEDLKSHVSEEEKETVEKVKSLLDFEYLSQEIPLALEQTLKGVESVTKIVSSVREIARPNFGQYTNCNINDIIADVITVSRGEWKRVARMSLELDPGLPNISCSRTEVGQAILQLVTNAAEAIATSESIAGEIVVSTERKSDHIEIVVQDNGIGIDSSIQHQIFDPFFTTKKVGENLGQGLALTYATIVEHHGGTIQMESTPGSGARFSLTLPITSNSNALDGRSVESIDDILRQ
ncbi:MAG: response regulator [Bdellovibrionales bacterium]|nr:response regulator [Bdellovibrionales bacterium]